MTQVTTEFTTPTPAPVDTTKFEMGASRFGSHFINTRHDCPMKWYNTFLRPHPDGGHGLETFSTAEPLMFGWGMHEWLAEYYRSGWKDGNYDVEAAHLHAKVALSHRSHEFESIDAIKECYNKIILMGCRYDDWYGQNGVAPDYPDMKIFDLDGEPVIEKEFEVDLGYKGYVFTSRFDGLCEYQGHLNVLEHKTTSASFASRLFTQMNIGIQATGQIFILRNRFPDVPIYGTLVNALVKNRGAKSDKAPFIRSVMNRTPAELSKFRTDIVRTLKGIEEDVEEYNHLLAGGMDIDEAARQVFTLHTNECVRFRPCVFMGLCKSPGYESRMLGTFRPRSRPIVGSAVSESQ